MAASVPLRRGLVSCLHSLTCLPNVAPTTGGDVERPLPDQDFPHAITKLIVPFYEKAFDRLPCKTMPDLFGLLTTGGFCLGLLDPVSNIILNTLSLLPEDAAAAAASFSPPPAGKGSKRSEGWHEIAARSYRSLVAFLVAYFGCLTNEQAIRYLYWADANLLLAVMLIQHDLYAEGEEPLDPDSERACAALEWATTKVGHPSPSTLAQVMTIRLKYDDFKLLEKQFSGDGTIMAEDALAIRHIVMSPLYVTGTSHAIDELAFYVDRNDLAMVAKAEDIPNTSITRITYSFQSKPIWSMQSGLSKKKLEDCLETAARQAILLKTPCGDNCHYLQTLDMYLHGMIHNFYIKALKLLPTPSGSLMRSFLTAGHCYGSMDPVSNIIVNSIWYYSRGSPLPLSEQRKIDQYIDILDPVALLPAQVCSLQGLTKLATCVQPQFSVAGCALETLCKVKCNFVEIFTSTTESIDISSIIHEAAMAAGHPLPLQLGELHQQLVLMPAVREKLLNCITLAQTINTVLPVDEITTVLEAVLCTEPVPGQAPELTSKASRMVSNRRSGYKETRSWFRSQIEKVLKDYTLKHFWGPKYKLDIILGVEKSWEGPARSGRHYCVNFTATSDLNLARELFFAQFWVSSEPNPSFCCPLPYPYVARCYYGSTSSRKIVYPDRSEYIQVDITKYGTHIVKGRLEKDLVYFSPKTMLEMDVVYFSPKTDVKLAEYLNYVVCLPRVPGHPKGQAGLKKARP